MRSGTVQSEAALGALCNAYWYPVFAYVRRVSGVDEDDAEDLTQDFFAKLIEKDYFLSAFKRKGRLRNFMLASLKRFLIDAHRRTSALKRGQDRIVDLHRRRPGGPQACWEGMHGLSPDVLFHRRWVTTLLDNVMGNLETEWRRRGRSDFFRVLEPYIAWNAGQMQQEAASELGIPLHAVRKEIFRLRRCYHSLLREAVRSTVDSADDVEQELSAMRRIFEER